MSEPTLNEWIDSLDEASMRRELMDYVSGASEDDERLIELATTIGTMRSERDRLRDALHHVKAHAHMAPETERIVDAALAEGGKG